MWKNSLQPIKINAERQPLVMAEQKRPSNDTVSHKYRFVRKNLLQTIRICANLLESIL